MTFKSYIPGIVLRVLMQFSALVVAAFLLVKRLYVYEVLVLPVIVYLLIDMYRRQARLLKETKQLAASVKYRDFTMNFNTRRGSAEQRALWQYFNEINGVFKAMGKERETQHLYLQNIMELVDTGILSYDMENGDVVWMNESLKQLLGVPYLKTMNGLAKRDSDLADKITDLKPGTHLVASLHHPGGAIRVLLSATAFQTGGNKYKLIAFQNVNDAMDQAESKAWKKLLSVMTHEIMNSIAPISSLADTMKSRLDKHTSPEDAAAVLDDLRTGVDTIKHRSSGLLRFTETYRGLNKIAPPQLEQLYVRDLFETVHNLMQPMLDTRHIELDISLKDPSVVVEGDAHLLEQVLINLVVNAVEAVKETAVPVITLSAGMSSRERVQISVSDNGAGMDSEVLEQVFVPFFTTRKNGNGIGLSLCKQIMMLHNGSIQVFSEKGKGTVFVLQF